MSTPWKNGIYTSDKNRSSIQRVDGQKVDMFTTAYLDFPDFPPTADGTWTFGDFGPAHEEVQKAAGGIKNNNVEMKLFHGKAKCLFNIENIYDRCPKFFKSTLEMSLKHKFVNAT